jgi:uncharacterized protein involved in exopolysaccharide biosynthesis
MKPEARGQEFRLSQAIYRRLLRAYPPRHRAAYGAAMAQLFRDQCRDAWTESPTWGLFKLWLRTLPDLASTSILERLAALKERKTMTDKLANLFGFRVNPLSAFFRVFVLVFSLVFITSVVITFILPESYASTARVRVEADSSASPGQIVYDPYFLQTTFEVIHSELVLAPVVNKLKLNEQWGKKYSAGQPLKTSETIEILRQRLQLAPVKNTMLISITAFSDDKQEAAQIANAVAESYRDFRVQRPAALAAKTLAGLQQQAQAQEQQIHSAQAGLDLLRAKFDITDHGEELGTQMVMVKKTLLEKDVQLSQLRVLSNAQKRTALPGIVADRSLSDLLEKLNTAEQTYVTLTNEYALSSVEIGRVRSLMEVLNQQIDDRIAGIMAGLATQLAATKAVADELDLKFQHSKPTPENQPYWDAKHDLDTAVDLHKLLIAKIEAEQLAAQIPQPLPAQITDPAEPGRAPVRPNKPVDIVLGGIFGIILASAAGGSLALLSFLLGRRVRKTAAAA